MNMDTHSSGSTVKNHISLKTVFGYSATRRTSYQSWFLVYQRVLPQACPLQHQWHLFSRKLVFLNLPQACLLQHPRLPSKEIDHSDHHPAIVSSESVDRQVRGDPFSSEAPEELLHEPTKIPKPKKRITSRYEETRIVPTYRNGCKNSEKILWMMEFLKTKTHTPVLLVNYLQSLWEVVIWVNTVLILTSRMTEIARSARGPKSQGPCRRRIGGAVPPAKKLVIWLQPITKFSVKVVNLETIIDMQSWCRTWPPNGSCRILAKQKTSQETERSLQQFLEPKRKPNSH